MEHIDIDYDDKTVTAAQNGKKGVATLNPKEDTFNLTTGVLLAIKRLQEAQEEVDWTKVAVDTKILVRDADNEGWEKRYFAKFEDELIYAWDDGATSFSAGDNCAWWKQAKLYKGEE